MHKLLRLIRWKRAGRNSVQCTSTVTFDVVDPWIAYMRAAEIAYGLPTSPPAITSDARVEEIIGNFRAQCMWHTSEFDREQCLSCAHFASIFLQETHSGMDEHASRRGLEQNQFNVLGLSTSHSPTPTASSSPISDSLSDARSKVRILHEREDHPHMCHTQRTEDGNLGLQWLAEDCLRLGAGDLEDRGAEERHSRLQKAGDKGRRRVAKFTPWCYDNEPQEGSLLQEEAVRKRLLRESQLNCKECQQVRLEDESEEILEIVVGGCIVTFSAGLTVQHVVTGFERCKIFVRNIPQNVGEEEIVGLLSTYCLGSQYMVVTDRRRLASKWELSVMMKVDVMGQIRARADKLELRGKPLDIEFGISNDLGREETSKVQHTRRAAPILPNLGSDRFICNICFNTPIAPRSIPCGHVYCTGCLHHMFASVSSGSSFPLCCLGDEARCSFPIPLSLIREFVASVAFDHLLSLAFDVHIAHHPDAFHPCPTPDCNQLYRPQRYTRRLCCPSCRLVICAMCGGDWHPGMNCEQARLAKKKDEQERLTEEYFRSQRVDKRCPACNMAISKIEGCNHMTCKCGVHFCWWCLEITTADVIYDHMRDAHGNIYEPDPPPLPPAPEIVPDVAQVQPPVDYVPHNDQAVRLRPLLHAPAVPADQPEDTQDPFVGVDYHEQRELLRQAARNRERTRAAHRAELPVMAAEVALGQYFYAAAYYNAPAFGAHYVD